MPFVSSVSLSLSEPEVFEQTAAPTLLAILHPILHVSLPLLDLRALVGGQDLQDLGVRVSSRDRQVGVNRCDLRALLADQRIVDLVGGHRVVERFVRFPGAIAERLPLVLV